jgi:hypothetical protein
MTLTLGSAGLWAQNLEHISITSLAAEPAATAPVASSAANEIVKEDTKWKRTYQWSIVALGAATAADVASSLKFSHDGQHEANGFLSSNNGLYGSKGAAIEIGMVGASLLMQHFLVKHHPGLRLPFALSNYGFAAFQAWNVHHNVSY